MSLRVHKIHPKCSISGLPLILVTCSESAYVVESTQKMEKNIKLNLRCRSLLPFIIYNTLICMFDSWHFESTRIGDIFKNFHCLCWCCHCVRKWKVYMHAALEWDHRFAGYQCIFEEWLRTRHLLCYWEEIFLEKKCNMQRISCTDEV